MEVILLEKVGKLGELGDRVDVRPGYGRNYLLPFGKAVPATPDNVAEFEARRAELEKAAAERRQQAEARAEQLVETRIVISANAGDAGKLFGSIGTADIAAALTETGREVVKSEVSLPLGAIREVGEYEIDLQLHSDVKVTVTVAVVPEQ
ncbi:MAG: 50S ribosomal protein L9 [Pseudomonadota bacterium]|nr:50S ribosomal protein L9 [Pseudomonadota bacterium]